MNNITRWARHPVIVLCTIATLLMVTAHKFRNYIGGQRMDDNSSKARLREISSRLEEISKKIGETQDANGSDKKHGTKFYKWIGIFFTVIVAPLAISFAFTPVGHSLVTYLYPLHDKPTCDNPQWLYRVPPDSKVVSFAFYVTGGHYPHYTTDGDPETAWLQWWPTTALGHGSFNRNYIEWSLDQRYDIKLVCIVNGWPKNEETYTSTLPIRRARIGTSVTTSSACKTTVSFETLNANSLLIERPQGFSFNCKTNNIVLQIISAQKEPRGGYHSSLKVVPYPGPGLRGAPLAGLSEISFYYFPSILPLFVRI